MAALRPAEPADCVLRGISFDRSRREPRDSRSAFPSAQRRGSGEMVREGFPWLGSSIIYTLPMELRIENLSKVYPNGVRALDDVSLTIPRGLFGLLGPTAPASRRSCAFWPRCRRPNRETVHARRPRRPEAKEDVRKILGYLPQDFGVYPKVSALDMLDHLALLKGFVRAVSGANLSTLCSARESLRRAQEGSHWIFRRHAPALRNCAGADREPDAADRRRAYRGARSQRAESILQFAFGGRRERHRDSVDPHRAGCDGTVHQHGDHRSRPRACSPARRTSRSASWRARSGSAPSPRRSCPITKSASK